MTDIEPIPTVTIEDLQGVASDLLMALIGPEFMWEPTEVTAGDKMAASIVMIGAGNPTVVVAADAPIARELAVAFFGPEDAADQTCWPEALSELANVMGGSIKPLLGPIPATLGFPEEATWPPASGDQVQLRCDLGEFGLAFLQDGAGS